MKLSEILTLFIAVYGALLSTVLGIRELRKNRRHARVICDVRRPPSLMGEVPEEHLAVRVVNDAHRPIEITLVGLRMSNGTLFTDGNESPYHGFPKRLEEGASLNPVYFALGTLRDELRKQKAEKAVFKNAVVRDAEGREYTSQLPRHLHALILSH